MPLADSNTFALPSQGSGIAISRTQFNSTHKALLQNFYGPSTPTACNLVDSGSSMSSSNYNGMMFRNSTTGMVYISDTAITGTGKTLNPVGGSFTRYGIAWRTERSLAAAAANISTYDIGEAFAIVQGTDPGGTANNSLWMRVGSTGTFGTDFVNIREPQSGTIPPTTPADGSVTGPKLATSMTAIPTTTMLFTSTPTIGTRIIFNSLANNQTINTSAVVELATNTLTNDVGLAFTNSSRYVMLKMIPDTAVDNSGLGIYSADAALTSIRANNILVPAITGSTSETVAPLIPAGVIVAWAGATAPTGWIACDGNAISNATYAALNSICGGTFGSGSGTFNVPDMRGRALYGTTTTMLRGNTSTALSACNFTATSAASAALSHSLTTASVSGPVKDVASVTAVTAVADHAGHTHTINYPGISILYIIKT